MHVVLKYTNIFPVCGLPLLFCESTDEKQKLEVGGGYWGDF